MSEFGRWVYTPCHEGWSIGHISDEEGSNLAVVYAPSTIAPMTNEAIFAEGHKLGRAMAAAQEMLAALEAIQDEYIEYQYDRKYTMQRLFDAIGEPVNAALAKAKGETDE